MHMPYLKVVHHKLLASFCVFKTAARPKLLKLYEQVFGVYGDLVVLKREELIANLEIADRAPLTRLKPLSQAFEVE